MIDRHIETFTTDWQGITLSVSYEPDWLNMGEHSRYATAHLQVESIAPSRAPFPLTETGYRSHFVPRENVEDIGGPVEFVRLWIGNAAKSFAWREYQLERRRREADGRQLSLF